MADPSLAEQIRGGSREEYVEEKDFIKKIETDEEVVEQEPSGKTTTTKKTSGGGGSGRRNRPPQIEVKEPAGRVSGSTLEKIKSGEVTELTPDQIQRTQTPSTRTFTETGRLRRVAPPPYRQELGVPETAAGRIIEQQRILDSLRRKPLTTSERVRRVSREVGRVSRAIERSRRQRAQQVRQGDFRSAEAAGVAPDFFLRKESQLRSREARGEVQPFQATAERSAITAGRNIYQTGKQLSPLIAAGTGVGLLFPSVRRRAAESAGEIIRGGTEFGRRLVTGQGFPGVGQEIRQRPGTGIGIIGSEAAMGFGAGAVGTRLGRAASRSERLQQLFNPGRRVVGRRPFVKTVDDRIPVTGTGRGIRVIGGTQSGALPTSQQLRFTEGQVLQPVSAQQGLVPRRGGTVQLRAGDTLEQGYFADPFGRVRTSRLQGGEGTRTPSLVDIATGDVSFRRPQQQIQFFPEQTIPRLPESLSDVRAALRSDRPLTPNQKRRLEQYQLQQTQQFKTPGFPSQEAEVTLAPGETVFSRRTGKTIVTRPETGERIPAELFESEIVGGRRTPVAARRLAAPQRQTIFSDELSRQLDIIPSRRRTPTSRAVIPGGTVASPFATTAARFSRLGRRPRTTRPRTTTTGMSPFATSPSRSPSQGPSPRTTGSLSLLGPTSPSVAPSPSRIPSQGPSPVGSPSPGLTSPSPSSASPSPSFFPSPSPRTTSPSPSPTPGPSLPLGTPRPTPGTRGVGTTPQRGQAKSWDVYIRRKGKYSKVADDLGFNRALQVGSNRARSTLAATFQLRPDTKPAKGQPLRTTPRLTDFRLPKKGSKLQRAGTFTLVEKRNRRLASPREVVDIQRKRKRR